MMNYAKLRDELIRQNGGKNIISCQHGELIIHDKVQWLTRTGVFLFPEHFPPGPESFREVAALELFHKPSKKLKLSAVVKGTKGDWLCDVADAAISQFDKLVNGNNILCPDGSRAVNNSDETTALIVKEISRSLEDAQITVAAKSVLDFLKAPDNPWVQKVTSWYYHVSMRPAVALFKEYQFKKKIYQFASAKPDYLERKDLIDVIDSDGNTIWMYDTTDKTFYFKQSDGVDLHRVGGPAIINKDIKVFEWHCNGKLHREDGPALDFSQCTEPSLKDLPSEYHIHGEELSEAEYLAWKKNRQ
jgi:hypothetical protein